MRFAWALVVFFEIGACVVMAAPTAAERAQYVAQYSGVVVSLISLAAALAAAAYMDGDAYAGHHVDQRGRGPRETRRFHPGPGIWDDYKDLFSKPGRRRLGRRRVKVLRREFKADLRLSYRSFGEVMHHCRADLSGERGRQGNQPLEPELVAIIALHWLANGCTYREVSLAVRNSISLATIQRCCILFQSVVVLRLGWLVRYPDRAGLQASADCFYARTGIPGIIGALDGSHIPVRAPTRFAQSYYNRKGWHSVVLQAVVDCRGYFMDLATGFPGRMNDSQILAKTTLSNDVIRWFSFERYGFAIYGDSIYPLKKWLLVGFKGDVTWEQEKFNMHGSRGRGIVEMAFGILKGQWRILQTRLMQHDPSSWNDTIKCCCILHNLMIEVDDGGFSLDDKFDNPRVHYDLDPDQVGNTPVPTAQDPAAVVWRQGLFDALRAGW